MEGAGLLKHTLRHYISRYSQALLLSLGYNGVCSERFYGKTPIGRVERLVSIFKEIRNFIAYSLEHKTLADVI